jgi:hypothetical protein
VGILNVGKLADALEVSLAELFGPLTQKPKRRRSS